MSASVLGNIDSYYLGGAGFPKGSGAITLTASDVQNAPALYESASECIAIDVFPKYRSTR
jgi:hypothetical protein